MSKQSGNCFGCRGSLNSILRYAYASRYKNRVYYFARKTIVEEVGKQWLHIGPCTLVLPSATRRTLTKQNKLAWHPIWETSPCNYVNSRILHCLGRSWPRILSYFALLDVIIYYLTQRVGEAFDLGPRPAERT